MNRILHLYFSLLIVVLSCSPDDSPNPNNQNTAIPATVILKNQDGGIFGDVRLLQGTVFKIVFSAVKGENTMKSYRLKVDNEIYNGISDLVPDVDNFTLPINNIPVPIEPGEYTFKLEIEDIKGNVGSVTWKVESITVEDFIPKVTLLQTDSTVFENSNIEISDDLKIWIETEKGLRNLSHIDIVIRSYRNFYFDDRRFQIAGVDSLSDLSIIAQYFDIYLPDERDEYSVEISAFDIEGNSSEEIEILVTKNLAFDSTVILTLGAQDNPTNGQAGNGPFFNISGQVYNIFNFSSGNRVHLAYYFKLIGGKASLYSPWCCEFVNEDLYDSQSWNRTHSTRIQRVTYNTDTLSANQLDDLNIIQESPITLITIGDQFLVDSYDLKGILKVVDLELGATKFIQLEYKRIKYY